MKVSIKTSFQLAIFCLLASFLVTCTKGKGNIYAEGRVYNPNSGEGIEGVEVILMRTNNPTVEYQGTPLKRKEISTTDADGNYKIEHIGSLFGTYELRVALDPSKYAPVGWDSGSYGYRPIKPKEEVYDSFRIVGLGFLEVHLKNVNCEGPADSFHFEQVNLLTNDISINNVFWEGCLDEDDNYGAKPAGNYRYDWYVIRGGVRTDSSIFFTINENDTTDVQIYY